MRVLMINYEFPPIGGGTGNACYYMLKEFAAYPDLTIDLVTFSPDDMTRVELFAPNINIYYVKCGVKQALHHWKMTELFRWFVYTCQFLRKHLRHHKYDLIHCWSGWPAGILGYLFRSHAPYIIALRGSDVPGHTPRTRLLDAVLMRRLSRRVWSRAAAVTTVSRYLADLARQTADLDFQIINNGVNTSEFYPASPTPAQLPIRLLYVGRLSPHKGVDDLLGALQLLRRQFEDELPKQVHLTIVGGGSLEGLIKQYIQTHGLTNAVTLRGIVKHNELPAIYRDHDILVFPCHSDAMANVILEAIASGLAIISTKTGGAELIDGNGLLVESKNPRHLGESIMSLLQNPALIHTHKQQSASLAKSIGWDVCCAQYGEVYRRWTSSCSCPTPVMEEAF